MSLRPLNLLRRAFAGLWWFVDVTRRTLLNLLFLLLVAAVLFAMAKREAPTLQDNTALVLALEGPLVEEMPGSVRDNAIARLGGESMHITRLRDVLAVLESAASRAPAWPACARWPMRSNASRPAASRSWPGARATTRSSTTSPRTPARC